AALRDHRGRGDAGGGARRAQRGRRGQRRGSHDPRPGRRARDLPPRLDLGPPLRRAADGQRPPPELPARAHAADALHLHAARAPRQGRDRRVRQEGDLLHELLERPGADRGRRLHVLRQERLPDRRRPAHASDQGRQYHRQRPQGARADRHGLGRPRDRRGRLDLRQGRPERARVPGHPHRARLLDDGGRPERQGLGMADSAPEELFATAERCVAMALAGGAREAAARAYKVRDVGVQWRDGAVEKVGEATTRGVGIHLYVDGRYAALTSSDLRPESLARFVADGIAMTRSLAPDPYRSLPDPALYAGPAAIDLQLEDPAHATVRPEERRGVAEEIEAAARAVPGADAILSVTTAWNDTRAESVRVHSNGFKGTRADTSFWISAQVSVKDDDGRRPED